jgi:putative transposase
MLMHAIAPKENSEWMNKGRPAIVQPDRGKTFLAHAVISSLSYLGIALDPDPPYYPNRKGKLERWFLTLDRGCLRILPGHMDAIGKTRESAEKHVHLLLTVPQLRKEIERWIVKDYHQRIHSGTGRKPAELWEETVRLRLPASEEALHLMLLKSDKERRVYNTGIQFNFRDSPAGEGHTYWGPELADRIGERVQLRYNPEDQESVLVYSAATNEYICEAWLMGDEDSRYTIEDVKRARIQLRRGMNERMKEYRSEIEREDRRRMQREGWDEARKVAVEQEESNLIKLITTTEEQLTDSILELFYNQDGRTDREG